MCVPASRQLQDVAPQGGGLIAATILFLSLAWSGIDPQRAEAVYDIPFQVISFLASYVWSMQFACTYTSTSLMCNTLCPCHHHLLSSLTALHSFRRVMRCQCKIREQVVWTAFLASCHQHLINLCSGSIRKDLTNKLHHLVLFLPVTIHSTAGCHCYNTIIKPR